MVYRLLGDGLNFIFRYIRGNRLRTLLSLLGITIGIFTIIAILVAVDSLKASVTQEFAKLGSNTIYVSKWGWGGKGEYPWWVYRNNPEPDYRDYKALQDHGRLFANVGMMLSNNGTVKYRELAIEEADVWGVTPGLAERPLNLVLAAGRDFTPLEFERGQSVCMLGATIASQLFPNGDALGKKLKIRGFPCKVVGVGKLHGNSMFGSSPDERIFVPLQFMRRVVDIKRASANVIVTGKPGHANEEVNDDIRRVLRASRHLAPSVPDNFALNRTELVAEDLESLFSVLTRAGWIIGGFSILVGGFGIANIMFVSVKERTRIIGIQKSLGAKSWFILFQYLAESVLLSLVGGAIGFALVAIIAPIATSVSGFTFSISWLHVAIGLLLSVVIGTVSGYIPAQTAARLDPVIAMTKTV